MINIRTGTIAEAVKLSDQIPEFDNPYRAEEYEKRLRDMAIAYADTLIDSRKNSTKNKV